MKKFDIPTLSEKDWICLQDYLDGLSMKLNTIEKSYTCQELTDCHILLGLIDMVLGRSYELDEAILGIKKIFKDVWAVECTRMLLTDPPKPFATIRHYHCSEGFNKEDYLLRHSVRTFLTKDEAIKWCKENYDNYEVINDDYEYDVIPKEPKVELVIKG